MNYEEIIQRLCDNGWESYLVGGAARDILIGVEPFDYDIVTNASYEDIEFLFSDRKVRTVGRSFLVCIIDGIEVSTYRTDKYFGLSDKNCVIEKADTLYEDLARRDFSINSLAFCPYTGEIIDNCNGLYDLRNRIIRFTFDPYDRIYEDPCRILRACRFKSKVNGTFSDNTFMAMKEMYHLLSNVPRERFKLELLKALNDRYASKFFYSLYDIGALEYLFPSLTKCFISGGHYHNEDVFSHSMIAGDSISVNKKLTKLAGYLHDIGKPLCMTNNERGKIVFTNHDKVGMDLVKEELKNLRFSTYEINYVSNLVKYHTLLFKDGLSKKSIRKILNKLDKNEIRLKDWMTLKVADRKANLLKPDLTFSEIRIRIQQFLNILNSIEDNEVFTTKHLDINGNDVMEVLNIGQGKEVGYVLDYLFEMVLEDPKLNDKDILIDLLKSKQFIEFRGNQED